MSFRNRQIDSTYFMTSTTEHRVRIVELLRNIFVAAREVEQLEEDVQNFRSELLVARARSGRVHRPLLPSPRNDREIYRVENISSDNDVEQLEVELYETMQRMTELRAHCDILRGQIDRLTLTGESMASVLEVEDSDEDIEENFEDIDMLVRYVPANATARRAQRERHAGGNHLTGAIVIPFDWGTNTDHDGL